MQRGSLMRVSRKQGPDVWQFRWSEKDMNGRRVYRKRVLGSVGRYADEAAARCAVTVFLAEINSEKVRMSSRSMTVAQLCDHFEQRELAKDNAWRSHATKKIYKAYLTRWILPHWRKYELAEVRTIQVESWLRTLPLAKSSCAKIRNLMSVLFNHARRYELFDRNPICLVRQSAKRRTAPTILTRQEMGLVHPDQNVRNATQNSLCRAVNRRRGCCACRASNCRRRARFSRTRSSRERKTLTNQPRKCRSDTMIAGIISEKSESSFAPSHSFCRCTTFWRGTELAGSKGCSILVLCGTETSNLPPRFYCC